MLVCRGFNPPNRTWFGKMWLWLLNPLWSQFIWPGRRSCLWYDVTCLLGCLLWKTSIWNMSSVLCLLLPFPLSCERCRDWWLFQMGRCATCSWPQPAYPPSFPLLFTPLSHLSISFTSLTSEDWALFKAARGEIFMWTWGWKPSQTSK